VTLDGTFFGTRAALAAMAKQGSGSIINISSGAALGGEPGLAAYGAAKAAVVNLTQTAAVENGPLGIRVNAILPGPIETPPLLAFVEATGGREAWARQIPARRLGRPEEMAAVALFLATDESSYISGAAIVADGGIAARTSAPRFD
jgi:meso-butanediol dehydrogenase/(S,S)-butanediol dehydrogenase/diacetyl reductase